MGFGMYEPLLLAHSWTRWIVYVGATVLFVRMALRARSHHEFEGIDNYVLWMYNWALSFQVLFGLSLYLFLSPMVRLAFQAGAEAMKNHVLRFWMVEHAFGMLTAFIIYQVGYRRMKKADKPDKYRIAAWTLGLVWLLITLSIPWPGMPYGRPLFRIPAW